MPETSEIRRAKLSNTAAKTDLPNGVDDLTIKDIHLIGFQLRIRKASRRWLFCGRVKHGQRRVVTLGDAVSMTADQARAAASRYRNDFAAGIDTVAKDEAERAEKAAVASPKAKAPTFAEVAERYYTAWAAGTLGRGKPRPATIVSVKSNFKRAAVFFGDKEITTITPLDVRAFKASLTSNEQISAGTASKDFTIAKLVFAYAVDPAFLIATSPALEVKGPQGSKVRERYLAADEIKAVWNAAGTLGRAGQLVRFLIAMPLRLNAARLADWSQISLTDKTFALPAEAIGNKAAKAMTLPLNDLAIEVLESLPFRSGPVFPNRSGKPVSFYDPDKVKLDEASGVTGWRLHDLRRTAATQTGNHHEAVDIDAFESLLQHTRTGIAGVYQQSNRLRAMRPCAAQWESTLRGFLGLDPVSTNVVPMVAPTAKVA